MAYKGYKGCGPNKLGASPLKQRSRNRADMPPGEKRTEGPDTKMGQQIMAANAYTDAGARYGKEFNTDSFYTGGADLFGEMNKSRPKQSQYPKKLIDRVEAAEKKGGGIMSDEDRIEIEKYKD